MTLEVVIAAHHSRSYRAHLLENELERIAPTRVVYDPEPHGIPSAVRMASKAWAVGARVNSDWLLVVQDDVAVLEAAGRWLRALGPQPLLALGMFTQWLGQRGQEARAAALAQCGLAAVDPARLGPNALLLPREATAGLAERLAAGVKRGETRDSLIIAEHLRENRLRSALTVPCMFEHDVEEQHSLLSSASRRGPRRAALTRVPQIDNTGVIGKLLVIPFMEPGGFKPRLALSKCSCVLDLWSVVPSIVPWAEELGQRCAKIPIVGVLHPRMLTDAIALLAMLVAIVADAEPASVCEEGVFETYMSGLFSPIASGALLAALQGAQIGCVVDEGVSRAITDSGVIVGRLRALISDSHSCGSPDSLFRRGTFEELSDDLW